MTILETILEEQNTEPFVPIEPTKEEKHIQYLKWKRMKISDKAIKDKYPWMADLREFNKQTYVERKFGKKTSVSR